MKNIGLHRVVVFLILGLVLTAAVISPVAVMAQAPAADTPTAEPPKPTATEPKPTATEPNPTATPGPGPSDPVTIPEPITVILFGTGLAALSASAAARRKKE